MVENPAPEVENRVEPPSAQTPLKSLAARFLKGGTGGETQVEPAFNPAPPDPSENNPVFPPRFQHPRRAEKDRHRYAFLHTPERKHRLRTGRKAEGLLRQHGLRRGGDETDETGRLIREGGGWWECPTGGHTYPDPKGTRWIPSLLWHDFHERYFCFNCHHSWAFEEMKAMLKKRQPKN